MVRLGAGKIFCLGIQDRLLDLEFRRIQRSSEGKMKIIGPWNKHEGDYLEVLRVHTLLFTSSVREHLKSNAIAFYS